MQAKETADLKAKELKSNLDSLTAELQKEKQASSLALSMANRACRENMTIRRAIESLGCKVHFSSDDSHLADSGRSMKLETRDGLPYSFQRDVGSGQQNERDLSVSIIAADDSTVHNNPDSRLCETMCPFRTGEGCRWPDSGCAQLGSQFVGLKANFDAFDRLSIYDRYFDSE